MTQTRSKGRPAFVTFENDGFSKSKDRYMEAFMKHEEKGQGKLMITNLRAALEYYGESVSDNEVFQLISDVDPRNTGHI